MSHWSQSLESNNFLEYTQSLTNRAALSVAAVLLAVMISIVMVGAAFGQVAPGTRTDNFGNTITSSEVNSHIPTDLFRDISGIAPVIAVGDDVPSGNVDLGFVFPFYGKSFTGLNFTTNGYISTDPADHGHDVSNDVDLPMRSSGFGDRIYPHHDDLEAIVYGAYFSAAASGFGTEAFIAQWNACHYNCDALNIAANELIQFNVALLRDGTIIMAHKLAGGEQGLHATVGIQDEPLTTGVAYSADSANSIVNGLTVVVIPKDSGISDDVQIAATEAAIVSTSAFAGNVHNRAAPALRDKRHGRKRHIWGSVIGARVDGELGSDLDIRNYGAQFGADILKFDNAIFGISAAYQKANVELGHVNLEAKIGSVAPYVGVSLGSITASATVGYAHVDYSSFDLVFLRDIHADSGKRVFGSASITADIDLGPVKLVPMLAISAAREKMGEWQAGIISRDVDNARFFRFSATTKATIPLWAGAEAYLLGGVERIRTKGDDAIALYATDYDTSRTGGVLGAGFSMTSGNLEVSADADASGLGSQVKSFNGKLRASMKF
ncbi:MAG: autotransporter outer membrane beta-barrel domain-containing protein [Pseudomonadota bacterium]